MLQTHKKDSYTFENGLVFEYIENPIVPEKFESRYHNYLLWLEQGEVDFEDKVMLLGAKHFGLETCIDELVCVFNEIMLSKNRIGFIAYHLAYFVLASNLAQEKIDFAKYKTLYKKYFWKESEQIPSYLKYKETDKIAAFKKGVSERNSKIFNFINVLLFPTQTDELGLDYEWNDRSHNLFVEFLREVGY